MTGDPKLGLPPGPRMVEQKSNLYMSEVWGTYGNTTMHDDVLVINTETGEVVYRFPYGTTPQGAIEAMSKDLGFRRVSDFLRCVGTKHLAFECQGIEGEDIEPWPISWKA